MGACCAKERDGTKLDKNGKPTSRPATNITTNNPAAAKSSSTATAGKTSISKNNTTATGTKKLANTKTTKEGADAAKKAVQTTAAKGASPSKIAVSKGTS
jgi:hypothetical protein